MLFGRHARHGVRWLAAGAGLAAGAYATYAGLTWCRYGRPGRRAWLPDAELDRFMPAYDVVERRLARIGAPAQTVWAVIPEIKLGESVFVRALLKCRELMLGGQATKIELPAGLVAQMKAIGWNVLSETSGREIVFGAVAKPWESDPHFRAVPPAEFADFREPGYVKIVWTLRVHRICADQCIFSTETRAMPTDSTSRAKFRRYWAVVLPGVKAIRRILVKTLKAEAERRAGKRKA